MGKHDQKFYKSAQKEAMKLGEKKENWQKRRCVQNAVRGGTSEVAANKRTYKKTYKRRRATRKKDNQTKKKNGMGLAGERNTLGESASAGYKEQRPRKRKK